MSLPRRRNGSPVLTRTDDVLDYWVERIALIAPEREHFSYSSMICEGDHLFHYGHHFELARIIRNKRGHTKLVLLNGDSWGGANGFGPSTASRQRDVRSAVARTGFPSLVAPFSALFGAGIDYETISPIHVRDDRQTIEEHSSRERPTKKLASMEDPSGATVAETYWARDPETGDYSQRERQVPKYVPDPNRTRGFSGGHGFSEGATRDAEGIWRWTVRRHWLGDSLFRARSTEQRTRKATPEEREQHERRIAWERELRRLRDAIPRHDPNWRQRGPRDYRAVLRREWAREALMEELNAHYEREPERSRLNRDGRVPITVTRWATFLSSFDYQEPRALYFLCELPYGAKPNTVEQAIELLKPPEVVAAEARGLAVLRQGDLFAIPTKLTKRQIKRIGGREGFTSRLRVLGTNHSVTEGIVCKGSAVLGRGVMRHEPDGGRAPDHVQRKLGDGTTWYQLVRNTVPRTH